MLQSQYPEVTEWGKYLEKFSEFRSFQTYTWNQGPGHPQPSEKGGVKQTSYPFLGPGQYKKPTNLLLFEQDDLNIQNMSHCSVDPCHKVPKDTRFSKDGVIKGLVQRTSNPNGPGHYDIPEYVRGDGGFTFAKATSTPDEIRARSVATVVPPPGTYEVRGMFDPSSDEEEDESSLSKKSKNHAGRKPQSASSTASSKKSGSSSTGQSGSSSTGKKGKGKCETKTKSGESQKAGKKH